MTHRNTPPPSSRATAVLQDTLAGLAELDHGRSLLELATTRNTGDADALRQNTIYSICRWQPRFDWILGRLQPDGLRSRHRRLAYWLLCQRFCLTTLPVEAAANVAVAYARQHFHTREAGFLNALFRRLLAISASEWLQRLDSEAPEASRSSLGTALWSQWEADFGPETARELGRLLLEPAPPTLRIRPGKSIPLQLQAMLRPLAPLPWSPIPMWEVLPGSNFFQHPEFRPQDFYIQDPSTLAAPALMRAHPGECLADLCCAPGGKSLLLAEAMQGQGELFCFDRSEKRLERVRENLAEFASLCQTGVADAIHPSLPPGTLDGVLLDVPCSNTGVVRRRPDVRRRFRQNGLAELVDIQAQILQAAAPLVKEGGRLVYSTCSIEPEENRHQVERFLALHHDYRLEEEVALMPNSWHDGGYAARLVHTRTQ